MIGTGLVLGSLAGLELSACEHFAGCHRSHTLLGGAVGMPVRRALRRRLSAAPAICAAAGALLGAPPGFSRLRSAAALAVPTRSGLASFAQRPDENPLLPRGQGAGAFFASLSPALASSFLRERARPQRRWLQSSSLRLML